MASSSEILITTEHMGLQWHASVWDADTTVSLATYKTGTSHPRTLCTVGDQYLLSAVKNKNLLYMWPLSTRDTVLQKFICPGTVSAVAVSPCNNYIALGIKDDLYIWKTFNGNLITVPKCHYQTIRCVRFTDDSSHVVSAGDDNQIVVWPLVRILIDQDTSTSEMSQPSHVLSDHSLPITDLVLGCGGINTRILSVSRDQTCKLWQMYSGELLMSVIFPSGLTACLMDATETRLFVAGLDSHIYQVNLYERPVRTERHISETECIMFKGHSKQVSCMAVSFDGTRLFTGSLDMSVRVWDISSQQCLKVLPHKGTITNLLVQPTPMTLKNPDLRPNLNITPLHRQGDLEGKKHIHKVMLKRISEKRPSEEVFTAAKRFRIETT